MLTFTILFSNSLNDQGNYEVKISNIFHSHLNDQGNYGVNLVTNDFDFQYAFWLFPIWAPFKLYLNCNFLCGRSTDLVGLHVTFYFPIYFTWKNLIYTNKIHWYMGILRHFNSRGTNRISLIVQLFQDI